MKVVPLYLGLAAAVCITVQAFDPLAPTEVVENYSWTSVTSQDELAFQAEEYSASASELVFRDQLLSRLESSSDFMADSADCLGAKEIVKNALATVKGALDLVHVIPVVGQMFEYLKSALDNISNVVDTSLEVGNTSAYFSINLAFTAAKLTLSSIAFGPLAAVILPIIATLESVQSSLNDLIRCATGAKISRIAIEPSYCSGVADMYRLVISESSKISPALNLPADASEDLKRLAAGSLSLLQLLAKSSIASTNEALLNTRPIFASDVLNQFRVELLRVADSDTIKSYAQAGLGSVVGVSNALEACLRVAADPVRAADELNEELEAQGAYEDENDENEDEDDDEDDEDEDYDNEDDNDE
ncbi:hypothetical protein BGZ99_008931 [Dissophora globulifera]|uniref:Uncharacterized protein n=1 Tax=Dissophora globulifera TaxID=979702 RepID=A0A9P6RTN0_9FUNG|nr:hypothetical protein BGZ99_008931 [Dissophora globulifera]